MEFADPKAVLSVDEPLDAEQEKQAAAEAIRQEYAQREGGITDGVLQFNAGDEYNIVDGQGQPRTVKVVGEAVDEQGQPIDGAVSVMLDGQQAVLPKEQIQQMSDAETLSRLNASLQEREAVRQEQAAREQAGAQTARPQYALNDEVTLRDENGNSVRGSITAEMNEDGLYEVYTESPINGRTVNMFTADELQGMLVEHNGEVVEQPTIVPEATEVAAEAGNNTNSGENYAQNSPEIISEAETQGETAPQPTALERIPKDEKGEPVYEQAPVDTTIADLYDGQLDDNEVQDFISANIASAQKRYDNIQKKAPRIGTSKTKYLEQKRKWQADVDEARRALDYWNEVNDRKQTLTHTTESEIQAAQAELSGQNAREEFNALNADGMNDAVSVASDFIRGAKITPESFRGETGYGTQEQRRFVGMIANGQNGGKSIDRLAEELVSYDNAELGGVTYNGDTGAAKNAILEALQSAGTRGNLTPDNTAEQERYVEARRAELDRQYMEAYGMTYVDYLAYEEQIMPYILRSHADFDEIEFYNLYAEEIENTLNARINEQRNDTTGEERRTDNGNEVLPGEGTDNTGGGTGGAEQGAEVRTGVQGSAEDGAVSEEAQTGDSTELRNDGHPAERQGGLDETEEIKLSDELDENGHSFVIAPNGSTEFGIISKETGLAEAPIKLSEGVITNFETNSGYGFVHIEARHGDQIRKAGYKSVVDFVQDIASNYDRIKEGNNRHGEQTYLLQLVDSHNNTLYIELSKDGSYWNVNSAGIFNMKYASGNKEVYNRHTQVNQPAEVDEGSPTVEQSSSQTEASTMPSTSADKVTESSATEQGKEENSADNQRNSTEEEKPTTAEAVKAAEQEVDTNPTEKQKEAGNYKKGHVQIGAFDVTIENPKGSVRSGVDANGNKWETEMHNTYGYIRGTEGVDGDHIDVFLADDIDGWDGRKVFVIDQYNTDGSFDEHKVMLGFNSAEEAHLAYLSNYEKGWQNTHKVVGTPVNIEDFEKWINSSHRKTKAFAEYKSVQKSVANEQKITDAQRAVGNAVTELLKDAGIEVVTDADEMRGVLGDEGAMQKMSVGSKEMVEWAVEAIGLVKPNLSKQTVRIVKADNHPFNTEQKTTDLKKEVVAYAEKNGIIGTMSNKESGDKGEVRISKSSISKFVDDSASDKSTDMNTHLSVLPIIKDVIKESIEAEVHPDYGKVDGVRSINNPINKNILIHRCYGATEINEKVYRVKVTLKEDITNNDAKKAYSYEVTKIELIENTNGEAVTPSSSAKSSITGANLLKGIEKSYDKGKYLLDESDNVSSVQTQFETQREISDKQYEKCEELLNALHNAGFKEFSISRSITHFGVSTYIQGQLGLKFRLSDHGVTSVSRIMSEDFISFETEPEDIVNYAKQKQEELNTQIAAKKAEKEKENKREAELDAKWKRIKHLFKGYVFKINNVGTYKHFADMESGNAIYVMQKPYFYNGNKSNNKWRYEWAIPKEYDTNGRGEEKPSYEWIEAFDENKSTVNTTQFLKTHNGEVYGFVKDGVVYLDPAMMNPNTPVHEYTHLWDAALRKANPELWARGKELMKQTPLWEEVKNDPAYADIAGNEDLLASEAHARLSGKEGEGLLDEMVEQAKGKGVFDTVGAVSLKDRVRQWLADTLAWVRDAFGKWSGKDLSGMTLEEFARMPVKDLASGRNMKDLMHKAGQVETVRKNNPAEDDYHTWVRNVGDVKTFDEMLADAERDYADYGDMTYPDITIDDLREARESGYITVYSSKPIRQGVFVTPSRMNAEDYAGGGKVYEKRVPTSSVAWIGQDEGQLADTGSRKTEDAAIQMMFIGENGAARLDVEEEAMTRLDNLDVAKDLEAAFNEKKARIEKLRKSEPVEITGEEYKGEYELNRESAKRWIKDNLRGEYTNADTGERIEIRKDGAQKVTSHSMGNEAHLKSLFAIPDLIEKSVFIEERPNEKDNGKYDSYRYYVCGLKIGGVDYTVKITVGVKGSSKYYDHALTEIEKGKLIDNIDALSTTFDTNENAPVSVGKDTKLLSILQTDDKENARKIKMATGWERGADGLWRYEVEDGEVKTEVLEAFNDFENGRDEFGLQEVLGNKELFDAYPELAEVRVRIDGNATEEENADAFYDPEKKEIVLSDGAVYYGDYSSLIHEVQHAVQGIEGFAPGGNESVFERQDKMLEPTRYERLVQTVAEYARMVKGKDETLHAAVGRLLENEAFGAVREGMEDQTSLREMQRLYRERDETRFMDEFSSSLRSVKEFDNLPSAHERYTRLAGEVEARNVQRRMGMSTEERRDSLAEETEDVAREDQLFLENALGTSAVMQEADKQTGDGQKSAGAARLDVAEEGDTLYRENDTKDTIETLFNDAVSGKLTGKPISIGRLTDAGREYLQKISGINMKESIDFVLNPSDLVHIYKDHFGNNEKDKGQNIPLDINDVRNIVDVISNPDNVVFFKENEGNNRNMFYFFKETDNGTYNLMEIYSDRKGNLTAKTFYKTRKDASQRIMDLKKSLFLTSETNSGAILSDAKIPQIFENPSIEDEKLRGGEELSKLGVKVKSEEDNDTLYRSFTDGADADELYDALGGLSEWSSGAYNLMSALEDYYGGEIKEISGGAKHALENGLVPVPGKKHSGLDGEYHHIRFEAQNGEEFVESVPFIMAKDVEGDHGLLFRYADINRRFNEELQQQIDGTLPKGHVYQMGRPGALLRSTGIADFPIELRAQRLIDKATKFDHDFNLSEVKDLPSALQHPIAVFAYGDAKKAQNIVLQLNSGGKNFIVGISITPTVNGRKIEINSIRNVFPKDNHEWVKWITDGKLLYVDKEKIQPILSQLQTNPADVAKIKLDLDSATKIVKNFENPSIVDEKLRGGDGAYSDDALSYENDPIAKWTGKSTRSKAQRKAFAQRERQRMVERVNELAEKLGLDNVEVVTDSHTLEGRKQRAKGFYSKSTGKITIVVPNHYSTFDIEQTLLHEAVAHYGLRKLFGEHFDTFLDNVFSNADESIRRKIVEMAKAHDWDFRTATEEYLAGLAESTEFEHTDAGWWNKIKALFLGMLHKIGFEGFSGVTLTDNELRYILWRSYENLREPGRYRSILGEAADVDMQHRLKVGNYADNGVVTDDMVAEAGLLEKVNERFNEELEMLTEKNADKVALSLGRPSAVLRAAGVEDKPMKLYGSKIAKKMKKHGFTLDELRDLPNAVANPIAVFNNYGKDGNRSILTELRTKQGNFLVTIDLGKGEMDADFNIVSSVFGKGDNKIVNWINKGFATYINKEKAQGFLHLSAPIAEASANPELLSATKIIKEFENPSIGDEKNGNDELFRNGDPEIHERGLARDRYEERVKRGMFQTQEALQDSMLGLREAMDAILKADGMSTNIEDVNGFENAYLGENRLSSVNKAEADAFAHLVFKPMLDEVANLAQTEAEREELTDYMMAKHGLERNIVMAERDYNKYISETPNGTKTLDDFRERDYAGLTALTDTDNVADAEAEAQAMVASYESSHDTTDLWDKVNAVSAATLSKAYECGMMSKETYEHTRDMFKYYIPLKGWDSNVAAEEYEYMSNSRGQTGSPRIITAKGRSSIADDPIATLAAASLTFINGRANPVSRPNCFAENSVFLRSSLTGV